MTRPVIAIVTGAAGAIGAAIVERLLIEGARVVATDLDPGPLDAAAAAAPDRVAAVQGDITDPALGSQLVGVAIQRFGAPTALIGCSGWLRDARIQNMEPELFRRLLDINMVGPGRLMAAILPALREQGYGRIISIASRAWLGNFGSSGYSAAKGGLVGASRSLALAHAARGITVNCIAPGFIDTPMARSMPQDIVRRVVDAIPVGRAGTTDDVAALVSFLLSEASGYITGQTILCCGGRSISNPI